MERIALEKEEVERLKEILTDLRKYVLLRWLIIILVLR